MIREQAFLLASGPWVEVRDGNLTAASLYDRHYSRNRGAVGCPRIVGPGERIVLLTPCVRALFVWRQFQTKDESVGPDDVNCAIFRNEGAGTSSELIRSAMAHAWAKWPGQRLYTYVNPRRVRSANPGYCFLMAGWETGNAMDSAYADGKSARMGRGAGWRERKLAEAGSGTKNNDSMDEALAEMPSTRNRRSVWTVPSEPFKEAHFATFPPDLIKPCILAGCPAGGAVLDPFGGAGTTGLVADRLQRDALLIELNPAYIEIAQCRIRGDAPMFADVEAA